MTRLRPVVLLSVVLWSLNVATAQTTIQNTTYTNGQTAAVSDPTAVTAGPTVTVSSGATVTYASPTITLSPGFTATEGSSFRAISTNGMTTYTLTVQNGTGSGSGFPAGTMQGITASGSGTFQNWTLLSGSGMIANASAPTTTFTLAASDATVRANFAITNPNGDDDNDGLTNGWEIAHGLNPSNPADAQSATSGGLTYLLEYRLGTDPATAKQSDTGNSLLLKINRPINP